VRRSAKPPPSFRPVARSSPPSSEKSSTPRGKPAPSVCPSSASSKGRI
jgi:hypothetical protein